jgi:hypothetical protein
MTNIVSNILTSGGGVVNNPSKKRIRKLSPNIIRIGDTIKIINPEIVIRVGYPMSFDDACKEVKELHHEKIITFLQEIYPSREVKLGKIIGEITCDYPKLKAYDKIIKALAFEHLRNKGFGGEERKLYTENRQELIGITAKVTKIFIRRTGIYFAPSGGYSYDGDYDYDPGGLDKMKTHKILELDYWLSNLLEVNSRESNYAQIEACNVEKIHG